MGATLKKTGNSSVITLKGDLTLPSAEELKKALIKALIDTDRISIVMKEVQDVDLSCLQLLCSAHRSAVRLQKKVAFKGNPPKKFLDLVQATGFGRITGCKLDSDKGCLWTGCRSAS